MLLTAAFRTVSLQPILSLDHFQGKQYSRQEHRFVFVSTLTNFLSLQYYLNSHACPWSYKVLWESFHESPPTITDTWTVGCTLLWAMSCDNGVCWCKAYLQYSPCSPYKSEPTRRYKAAYTSPTSRASSQIPWGSRGKKKRFPWGCWCLHQAQSQGSAGVAMAPGGQETCGRRTVGTKSQAGSDRHKQVKARYRISEGKN